MRLFVALDIPPDVRSAIAGLIARVEKTCRGARWVRVQSMHITLKFIGEVQDEKVEPIRRALSDVHAVAAVEMNFRGTGFFPNAKHPRVFWAGIEATPNLGELAAEIERRLEVVGIPREQRPFKPHLTLARFKSEDGLPRLHEALAAAGPCEFGRTMASEFHLYQSELKAGGAVHTRLATFPFVEGPQ